MLGYNVLNWLKRESAWISEDKIVTRIWFIILESSKVSHIKQPMIYMSERKSEPNAM